MRSLSRNAKLALLVLSAFLLVAAGFVAARGRAPEPKAATAAGPPSEAEGPAESVAPTTAAVAGARPSAATASGAASPTSDPDARQTPSEPAVQGFKPPQRGPGAVDEFDPAMAPLVPDGVTLEEYASAYYDAVLAEDWEGAYEMVPKAAPDDTVEDFKKALYGYEIRDYDVLSSTSQGVQKQLYVYQGTPDNGVWNVVWTFYETPRGIVLDDLTYFRPGEKSGCH